MLYIYQEWTIVQHKIINPAALVGQRDIEYQIANYANGIFTTFAFTPLSRIIMNISLPSAAFGVAT